MSLPTGHPGRRGPLCRAWRHDRGRTPRQVDGRRPREERHPSEIHAVCQRHPTSAFHYGRHLHLQDDRALPPDIEAAEHLQHRETDKTRCCWWWGVAVVTDADADVQKLARILPWEGMGFGPGRGMLHRNHHAAPPGRGGPLPPHGICAAPGCCRFSVYRDAREAHPIYRMSVPPSTRRPSLCVRTISTCTRCWWMLFEERGPRRPCTGVLRSAAVW